MAVHILNDEFNKKNIIFQSFQTGIKLNPDLLSIEMQWCGVGVQAFLPFQKCSP